MRLLFAVAIFTGAVLTFMVQPLAAKLVLPLLGGTPAVWATTMVFFQGLLLAGYAYAHFVGARFPLKAQVGLHTALLVAAAFTLPVTLPKDLGPPPVGNPSLWLLGVLAMIAGAPFAVASATSPLLQRWFSRTGDAEATNPYALYVASNAGSLLGLLAYPFAMEPGLRLREQGVFWMYGYFALAALIIACGVRTISLAGGGDGAPLGAAAAAGAPTPWRTRGRWVLLAFVPSTLLLGVTLTISTDVAAIPLMWVVPLSLYLITFMLAFSPRVRVDARAIAWALAALTPVVAAVTLVKLQEPLLLVVALHLAAFFAAAWMCHKLFSDERPPVARLTEYYMWLSVGGVLGGVFAALVAPSVFNYVLEYPLALAGALLLAPQVRDKVRAGAGPLLRRLAVPVFCAVACVAAVVFMAGFIAEGRLRVGSPSAAASTLLAVFVLFAGIAWALGRWPGGALATGAALCVAPMATRLPTLLHQERTYFGVHEVINTPSGRFRHLMHGTTIHGSQYRPGHDEDPRLARLPTSYYHPAGPYGQVFTMLARAGRNQRVGVIGMGAGGIAAYGLPGMRMTFFEIDPAVERIARDKSLFTFVQDSQADVDVVLGDGRVALARQPQGEFDLLVLDAFTSDAVPTHLLTVEAFRDAYLPRMKPHGVVLVHISSRYFDLAPVLGAIGRELGLVAFARTNDKPATDLEEAQGRLICDVVVFARSEADLLQIPADSQWRRLTVPAGVKAWSDDHANLLATMKFD
ncbi:MAG TPA: fused MFS/spermidine synthase [Phycisphaerales bacterium]|nr:fused MFS/spermidine synthase [Phycisphaerales bacterium]